MKDSLPNMNDDELDKLFRKVAEEHDAAGSSKISSGRKEEAWEKIQEKLDAPPPAHTDNIAESRNTRKFLLLILLLIIAGIIVWQVSERSSYKPSSSLSTNQLSSHTNVINQDQKDAAYKQGSMGASSSTPVRQTTLSNHADIVLKQNDKNNSYPNSLQVSQPLPSAFQLSSVPYLPVIADYEIKVDPGELEGKEISYWSGSLAYSGHSINYTKPDTITASDSSMLHVHKAPESKKIPRWYLGITAGPNRSSASGEGWGTGFDAGLTLDYRLNKKWMFEVGILADKAIYTASPYDYNPPRNPISYGNIKSIDANCMIIELPLNVNYTIWSEKGNAISIGTGLSSTWMHHEAYTYNIKTNTGAWEKYQEEMYNKEHQLFSILDFSAGYQRNWKNLSFGISPYVKIPLNGIGYGRVKVLSTGIHISFKYGLK